MKKIFIICSVRGASDEYVTKLERYVLSLEQQGYSVHLPHRDTNQKAKGYDICLENCNAIKNSDEVHVFYSSESQGTHFDMGVAFAFNRKIVVVENEKYGEGKSYPRMLDEWSNRKPKCRDCEAETAVYPDFFGGYYVACSHYQREHTQGCKKPTREQALMAYPQR